MGLFPKVIYIKGRRLYFYSKFYSYKTAKQTAKYYQKKLKNNYFILIRDSFNVGNKVYGLYMNKVISFV